MLVSRYDTQAMECLGGDKVMDLWQWAELQPGEITAVNGSTLISRFVCGRGRGSRLCTFCCERVAAACPCWCLAL